MQVKDGDLVWLATGIEQCRPIDASTFSPLPIPCLTVL
jgi:hypothetical protein